MMPILVPASRRKLLVPVLPLSFWRCESGHRFRPFVSQNSTSCLASILPALLPGPKWLVLPLPLPPPARRQLLLLHYDCDCDYDCDYETTTSTTTTIFSTRRSDWNNVPNLCLLLPFSWGNNSTYTSTLRQGCGYRPLLVTSKPEQTVETPH